MYIRTSVLLFFASFFLSDVKVFAQKEDMIWYFGGDIAFPGLPGAGLDFNSGTAMPLLNSNMGYTEGSAVQCDRNGNLLFYTNGENVWDKTHAVMSNGAGLGGHISTEQSSLIIPFPSYTDTNKFYLFGNDGFPTSIGTGLHYSIVDMELNSGLGAVNAIKAIPVQSATSEWLSGTSHSNGIDFWVVSADYDSAIFYAYKITSLGISPAVISNLGFNSKANFKLDFNNKGNKVTFKSYDSLNLYYIRRIADFDQTTGMLSNPVALDTNLGNDGAGFSPSDSLLYCVSREVAPPYNMYLFQYAVYASDIYASKQLVFQFHTYPHADIKSAPDGKLYVSNATIDSLDVIHLPNISGPGCNYQANNVYLGGKKYRFFFPNRTFEIAKPPVSVEEIDLAMQIVLYPNPSKGMLSIEYVLLKGEKGNLLMYDVTGKLVAEYPLEHGGKMTIRNSALENGIYFYQVRVNGKIVQSDKLIIVK